MTRGTTAALLAAGTLLLGACGGPDEDKAATAIAGSISQAQKSGGPTQLAVTAEEADCIGKGWVDRIGTDKLQKYGVLTEDLRAEKLLTEVDTLSRPDAKSATTVLFDCADVPAIMKKVVARSGRVPKKMQTCINSALTEKNLRPYLEKNFEGKAEEAQKRLAAPMTKCALGNKG
ncbi:MAG TPA: hypothetical protein VER39_13325 [Nocardioidaceae bacterium]|nr:hypothetical protein [Nocardioidaceae bacterium]